MNLQYLRWLFVLLLALESLGTTGCSGGAATKRSAGRSIVIFLDLSESVKDKQRARWLKIGQTL